MFFLYFYGGDAQQHFGTQKLFHCPRLYAILQKVRRKGLTLDKWIQIINFQIKTWYWKKIKAKSCHDERGSLSGNILFNKLIMMDWFPYLNMLISKSKCSLESGEKHESTCVSCFCYLMSTCEKCVPAGMEPTIIYIN